MELSYGFRNSYTVDKLGEGADILKLMTSCSTPKARQRAPRRSQPQRAENELGWFVGLSRPGRAGRN